MLRATGDFFWDLRIEILAALGLTVTLCLLQNVPHLWLQAVVFTLPASLAVVLIALAVWRECRAMYRRVKGRRRYPRLSEDSARILLSHFDAEGWNTDEPGFTLPQPSESKP